MYQSRKYLQKIRLLSSMKPLEISPLVLLLIFEILILFLQTKSYLYDCQKITADKRRLGAKKI